MRVNARQACLLGPYPGNTHISINNYFDYCRSSIQKHLSDWDFVALQPGQFAGDFLKKDVSRIQAWKELYLDWPLHLRLLKADVFHVVDQGMAWYRFFLPSGGGAGKTIVTVHDLINVLNIRGRRSLESLPKRRQMMIKICVSQIQRSEAIICPSHATADDVARELELSSSKIHVIHNMIPSVFQPLPEAEQIAARKRIYSDVEHVILHVGKPTAYKNRLGVLRIFDLIHAALPNSRLALTSQALTNDEQAFLFGRSCANAVQVFQPAEQQGLRELYCAADVFLFPSITEGFGWPPVEAMACGCPVISSTGGALSEVVGQGAVRIEDPLNDRAFADAAIELLRDKRSANQWRGKGLSNSQRFAENTLGSQLADLYSSLAG